MTPTRSAQAGRRRFPGWTAAAIRPDQGRRDAFAKNEVRIVVQSERDRSAEPPFQPNETDQQIEVPV